MRLEKSLKISVKKSDKPLLKGAYINSDIYIGDDQLDALATIKSKEELIGEIIGLLQSPAQRVISALQNQFANSEEATEVEA
jgi:large subunit ribosomal protein L10